MLVRSLTFSSDLILNFATYQELMEVPWWIAVFYSSELGGTIGGILRSIGSGIALYSAWLLFRRKEKAYPQIRKKVAAALVLEASFFLFLIPTVILGFVYPATHGNLWYFDVTPVPEVFFVAGVACIALVTIIPVVMFKLTSKIMNNSPKKEIVRWSLIAGISYLFVVFWFDAFMQWVGMITAFETNLLLDPLNLAGFAVSVFGLFLVATFALVATFPFLKKERDHLNVRHIGAVMVSFGIYFLFGILIYFLAGGFSERPFAWYEITVPHNPYLWCVMFFFAGIPLIVKHQSSGTVRVNDLTNKVEEYETPKLKTSLDVEDKEDYLQITGEVWNLGHETAYMCKLHVILYEGDTVAKEAYVHLGDNVGMIAEQRYDRVDAKVYYEGAHVTNWEITPLVGEV